MKLFSIYVFLGLTFFVALTEQKPTETNNDELVNKKIQKRSFIPFFNDDVDAENEELKIRNAGYSKQKEILLLQIAVAKRKKELERRRQEQERLRREQEERDRQERLRREQEERDRQERLRREQEERDRQERLRREQEERDRQERLRREQEERDRQERLRREQEERDRQERLRREQEERDRQERLRREQEERDRRERLRREKEEKERACKINTHEIEEYSYPLLIDSSNHDKFAYPDNNSILTFPLNSDLTFGCEGMKTYTCFNRTIIKDKTLTSNFDIKKLHCNSKFIKPEIKLIPGSRNNIRFYKLGLSYGQQFLPTINVYYSIKTLTTIYTSTFVSKAIRYKQTNAIDQPLKRDNGINWPENVYEIAIQKKTFNNSLHCHNYKFSNFSCNYIDEKKDLYFVPSILTRKTNFFYSQAGRTSFYYHNSAPQWKSIRDGNWATIEKIVQDRINKMKRDVIVYTGVFEILQLLDEANGKNHRKDIYLNVDYSEYLKEDLPVPLYFWKILKEPSSKDGIVFVTVNNPYIKRGSNYHLCKNPQQTILENYSGWDPKNIHEGFSYTCQLRDFLDFTEIQLFD